ncbi:hypothetical protein D9M68_817030 [compost metagenome]
MPGDGAKAIGQSVALAGAGDAHEVQLDLFRRVHPRPEVLHQQLIGQLDDGTHHRRWVTAVNRFANHRAVHLGGGQGIDAEAGDQQKNLGRVGVLAEFFQLALVIGVDHIEKQDAAHEVHRAHGITPDAHSADQQQVVARLGVEHAPGQRQREQHQQG